MSDKKEKMSGKLPPVSHKSRRASIASRKTLQGYDMPIVTIAEAIELDRLDVFTKCTDTELLEALKDIPSEKKDMLIVYLVNKLKL